MLAGYERIAFTDGPWTRNVYRKGSGPAVIVMHEMPSTSMPMCRAAIASGVKMTYKILFNDAVAMTGGHANDGGLTVPQIAAQVAAEGASRVVVVTDEPWKYAKDIEWPRGLTVHHRDDLDSIQRELTAVSGVSVLIYDQTCAAEKRRRRKRAPAASLLVPHQPDKA